MWLVVWLAFVGAGCASAERGDDDSVSCTPFSRECNDGASYRVCSASGASWEVTSCVSGSVCVLGQCERRDGSGGDRDAGLADTGATDSGEPVDTGAAVDSGPMDSGAPMDSGGDANPEDTRPQEDTAPPEDTRPPEDTSPPEDTRPPEDTAPPEDTRPPEDTAPPEDTRPADPCRPNPCTGLNRTQCEPTGADSFTCECDPGTVEQNGLCVVPETCGAGTCSGAGVCDDGGGAISCRCDTGYAGDRCQRCDTANGYELNANGLCTNDPCDPNPCTAPGPCEEGPGTCNPNNGACSYATSALCASATGNWRWSFENADDAWETEVSLTVNPNTGVVQGTAFDFFGLSVVSGSVDARVGTAQLSKDYVEGRSEGAAFVYMAALDAPGQWSGSWEQDGVASNNGTFSAARQTRLSSGALAGDWIFEADFGDIDVALTVDSTGLVEGTMVDSVGDATVLGVFNRDDGLLRLRKVYNDTGTDWWYMGVLSGGVLTGGVWMADSDGGQSGVWTGRRP